MTNNTIIVKSLLNEVVLTTERTIELIEKQEKIVKKFTHKLFDNAPVMPRIVIGDDIKIEYIMGSNGPIANHKSVKYIDKRLDLEFTVVDDYGHETIKRTTVGAGTNYRYTQDLIKLQVSDAVASDLDSIKAEYVLVKYNKSTEEAVDARIAINGRVEGILVEDLVKSGYKKYAVKSWSNSDERNGGILCYCADNITPEQAFKYSDEVFGGALSARLDSLQHKMSIKDLEKLTTRNGIFNAPMLLGLKLGGSEHGVLVVESKLEGVEDYTPEELAKMKEMGIDIDSYTFDGMAIKNARLMKDIIKHMLKIDITEEEACRLSAQERADVVVSKTYSATECDEVFNSIVAKIKKCYKTFVIGNDKKISLIIDANAYKLMTQSFAEYVKSLNLYVLDIARTAVTNTSGQLIEKFMVKNPVATLKVLNELGADTIDAYAYDIFETESDHRFTIRDNGSLTLAGDVLSGLVRADKERAKKDRCAMDKLIAGAIKLQESAVKKIKLPCKSMFLRALFDYSKLIQDEVEYVLGYDKQLKAVECYNVDAILANMDAVDAANAEYEENLANGMDIKKARKIRKEALDKVLTAVAIKYPCPGSEEFQLVRFLTLEEIAERIVETVSDENNRKLLLKYFATKGSGCVLIAPINTLKNKLAGMDTDYDAIAVIFEEGLVDIMRDVEETSCVCIDTKATVPQYKAQEKAKQILNKAKFKALK